jgi:hypothetical protein
MVDVQGIESFLNAAQGWAVLTLVGESAHSGRMGPKPLHDNQEDREVYLRDHRGAGFIEAVRGAHRRSADTVVMTVKAFAGEPEVLYVALDYAYHNGTSVTMAPERGESQPATSSASSP